MRSVRYALLVAGGYAVFATLYITLSTEFVGRVAPSVEEAARVETLKGWAFVALTTCTLGFFTHTLFRRIEKSSAQLVQRNEALVTAERRVLASVMAASVAHDSNNALTSCMAELDELVALHLQPPAGPAIARLGACLQRIAQLNERLLDAGRERVRAEQEDVPLQRAVDEAVRILGGHHRMRRIPVKTVVDAAVVLRVQPVVLHQMLMNLLLNAAEATGQHPLVEVRGLRKDAEVWLEVHDNGPGIPQDRRATLFESLTTTKEHGSGLGLFSVKACAESLGGSVEVLDSPLGGACFRVRIPSSSNAPAAARG